MTLSSSRAVLFGALFATGVGLLASCREPTEVLVEIRTDVASRPFIITAITAGAPGETEEGPPTTETREPWGPDGVVGSLGIVPASGDSELLSVKVVMGLRRHPSECTIASPNGCIFARRRLRYSKNRLLRLPIVLYSGCEGIPCDPESTCNYLGRCVPVDVDPGTCTAPNGCTIPGEPPPGTPPPLPPNEDASAGVDAALSDAEAGRDTGITEAGSDGGPSVKVECGGTDCLGGQDCCIEGAVPAFSCSPLGTCRGGTLVLRCDDVTDCAEGSACCFGGMTASCAPAPCPAGQTELCGNGGPCAGGGACQAKGGDGGGGVIINPNIAPFVGVCN